MNALRAAGRFLYGFVIGDDWRLTAGVAVCLALTAWLLTATVPTGIVTVGCGCALALWFAACVLRDAHRNKRGR